MSRDELRQLLRDADATAAAPPLAADLPAQVRRRLVRRRERRAMTAALGVFILVGFGIFAILRTDPPAPRHVSVAPLPPATTRIAPALLTADDFALTATLHELTATKLLAASALMPARPTSSSSPSDA